MSRGQSSLSDRWPSSSRFRRSRILRLHNFIGLKQHSTRLCWIAGWIANYTAIAQQIITALMSMAMNPKLGEMLHCFGNRVEVEAIQRIAFAAFCHRSGMGQMMSDNHVSGIFHQEFSVSLRLTVDPFGEAVDVLEVVQRILPQPCVRGVREP